MAILEATVALLAESGLEGTTTQAIADRAGVARATVYLRWPTREAVINAALRHAIGRDPAPLSGDIEEDMRRAGRQGQAIFSQALFRAVIPVLIREFLRRDGAGVTFDALFPGRVGFAKEYDRFAGRQGFRTDVDGELVVDMVIGAMLLHFLATTSAPTARYCDRLVDLMIGSLRLDPPTTTR